MVHEKNTTRSRKPKSFCAQKFITGMGKDSGVKKTKGRND